MTPKKGLLAVLVLILAGLLLYHRQIFGLSGRFTPPLQRSDEAQIEEETESNRPLLSFPDGNIQGFWKIVEEGNAAGLRALLAYTENPNYEVMQPEVIGGGSAPLLVLAAGGGHPEIIKILLEAGADVHIAGSGRLQRTAIGEVCSGDTAGHAATLRMFLQAGARFESEKELLDCYEDAYLRKGDGSLLRDLFDLGLNPGKISTNVYFAHLSQVSGDAGKLRALLSAGVNPNGLTREGLTYLGSSTSYSAPKQTRELIKTLLDCGADVNKGDREGETALMRAAGLLNKAALKILLDAGADVSLRDKNGDTALHHLLALRLNRSLDTEIVRLLVQAGASPESQNHNKKTPIDLARAYDTTIMEILEGKYRPPESSNSPDTGAGYTPSPCDPRLAPPPPLQNGTRLLQASSENDAETVQAMLDEGVDVNFQEERFSITPLRLAVENGHTEVVRLLLEGGADPDLTDKFHTPPLAIGYAYPEIVKLLVEAGATANFYTIWGQTNLLNAISQRAPLETLRLLLEADADPNPSLEAHGSNFDWVAKEKSAIYLTVRKNHSVKEKLKLLFAFSANPNIRSDYDWDREYPLHAAIKRNRPDWVSLLLEGGADADLPGGTDKLTALACAAKERKIEIVQLILKSGANPNAVSQWDRNPLFHAMGSDLNPGRGPIGEDRIAILNLLLQAGADPNKPSKNGTTPLQKAVRTAINAVPLLLDAGANPNAPLSRGESLLMEATNRHRTKLVEYLLENGADPNARSEDGTTALMVSLNPEITRMLIEAGAKINARDDRRRTALMRRAGAMNWNTANSRLLLQAGADIHAKDIDGNTALLLSAQHLHAGFGVLLEAGSDPAVMNRHGRTILHNSAWTCATDRLRTYLNTGMEVNQKDNAGNSPLLEAAKQPGAFPRCKETIKLLLEAGADANAANDIGETPLLKSFGYQGFDPDTVQILLRAGANPNVTDNFGSTLLMMALAQEYPDVTIVQELLKAGANLQSKDKPERNARRIFEYRLGRAQSKR